MSWTEEHLRIQGQVQENSLALLGYLDKVRKNTVAHYRSWAEEFDLSDDALEVLAGCAASEGLSKAIRQLDRWDPKRGRFVTFATLKAVRIAHRSLEKIEKQVRIQSSRESTTPFDPPMRYSFWRKVYEKQDITDILQSLKPEHSKILQFRFYERRPFKEIAQHFGRSVKATKMLYSRALTAAQRNAQRLGYTSTSPTTENSTVKLSRHGTRKATQGDDDSDPLQLGP